MRSKDGLRFDHCIGLQDRSDDGKIFDANVLTCHDKPLSSGESIRVAGRAYRYNGDDNLGNSIFTATEPFPKFETIERPYKDNLFVVLEMYPMRNGHCYVRPYVQSGSTSSDHHTRWAVGFTGEFESREAAEHAGFEAAQKEIDIQYS